ncbi:MAG: Polysaccharide biosynthesis/export protein [Bacteroidetes bacterium ADurb.Bin217]|nr:MAG: Polysaccharide biosynthesis/export protein [Bacteroidetes bacterium ADurb.Bin217]
MNKLWVFLIFITVITFFSGCTSNKNLVYLENLPQGTEKISTSKQTLEYTLQKGDIVYVKILSINKELNELFNIENSNNQNAYINETSINLKGFTIDNDGYIRLPVIDTVKIEGLQAYEAERVVQTKVNEYFKNATVVLKPLNTKISILGEVNRPGQFVIYRNNINILEAIAMAGDVNQFADKKKILIIRTINNTTTTYRVDLTDKNVLSNKDFYLMPNDIVIVEPLNLKSFRVNTPTISIILSGVATIVNAGAIMYGLYSK